ncbi:MAG: selenocysteine-specific translation elongation factor [Gammaproteobacteria bacterium]|nr:selenocysteine-specific translation elongation factor [Gammaproteobacteria bacterium]MDP2141839.1 selenocysteine-specific translation elongation factor [Gammaproteobacteria bacterium]MDP2348330.1 selenocysteine-specific translation elongation factor [Gammaproteobacteria bacterium]
MIVVTAGHVDHGKTTLIHALTGKDTDSLAEEKARGMSIDLGFAYHHFSVPPAAGALPQRTISFVDVPGHTDFIGNMLAGAWSANVAMIVVAADDGIMPQTREHMLILQLLGIKHAVVVVTAIDRVEASRIEEVNADIQALLTTTSLQVTQIFAVSARTGKGIAALLQHLEALVLGAIDLEEHTSNCFRFAVDRSFTLKGIGTIVTGTVCSGCVRKDDELLHSGTGELLRIRSLQLDDQPVDSAFGGQRVALGVTLPHNALRRGDWLMNPALHHPVSHFDACVFLAPHNNLPNTNTPLHLHLGAAHHIVTLRTFGVHRDNEQLQWGQIRSREPMTTHWGDRFILRDASAQKTIAGGRVIDTFAHRRKPDIGLRLAKLNALCNDHEDALCSLLEISPHGVSLAEFAINRNASPAQIQTLHQQMLMRGAQFETLTVRGTGSPGAVLPALLGKHFYIRYRDQIMELVAAQHLALPTVQGVEESALFTMTGFSGSTLFFNALLRSLVDNGKIVRTGTLLHLPDHKVIQSEEEQRFMEQLRPILLEAGNVAPRVFELMERMNLQQSVLERLLKLNCRAGKLLQVSRNRFYLPETLLDIANFTESLAREHSDTGFSVIQFRDGSGIGRNLSIEILEYFDALGFTRRYRNARLLRTAKEDIFNTDCS